jgi:uncharacterized protein YigE (DUF2233 family)
MVGAGFAANRSPDGRLRSQVQPMKHADAPTPRLTIAVAALVLASIPACAARADISICRAVAHEGAAYTVCEVDLRRHDIKLFWRRPDGQPYGYPGALPRSLGKNAPLRFATNGGMYHPDGSPVGLYVDNGRELVRANTNAGPGNFHMRPNGVFYRAGQVAGVMETRAFLRRKPQVEFATQSGPMLVIDGRLHPRFAQRGGSRKYRVGVGSRDESKLVFAVSETEVSFGEFARLFRDRMGCRNALFLDGGSATSFYSPELKRDRTLLPLGPMIAVYGRTE